MPGTEEVLAALRHVIDPEIGINVVDLGLVYEVLGQDGHVHVVMTMTTAACPLGESITEEVRAAILEHHDPGLSAQLRTAGPGARVAWPSDAGATPEYRWAMLAICEQYSSHGG